MNLTKRQRQILNYIVYFQNDHGYSPSIPEIAEHFHLSSYATVHKHLVNLEERGAIERIKYHERSITVLL